MPVFPLIADPRSYQPDTIDMVHDPVMREYWIRVFEHHLPGVTKLCVASQPDEPDAPQRAERFAAAFAELLREVRRDPAGHGPLAIRVLCSARQKLLIAHGFDDPYKRIKDDENAAALKLLPALLSEHDAIPHERDRLLTAVRGMFAGNIFDLGCKETIKLFEGGKIDFRQTREEKTGRPWCVDHFDALADRLAQRRHRKAVIFVDNAGSDIVLGMIPMARHLLQRGTDVVLTANTLPALNDITHVELIELIERIAGLDETLASARAAGRLTLVPSGNGIPVINLLEVSADLAAAAADADLLIIEGMGRALETNYHARFSVDTLKVAMIKEQSVADVIGGRMYDVVCKFERAV